ncbi:uncharacterized protein LOC108104571 isoform X2 [Drosophila eugracilis]|nr:uncharacterized protein LOC108104571 isoform X2 [Drosophila eugracilis]
MTHFNATGAMMPLDEYYEQCVVPKPRVPRRYSSNPIPKRCNRQAGRLRSYKDVRQDDEEDEEDEDFLDSELVLNDDVDGYGASEIHSSTSQNNFEINDFNKVFCEESSEPEHTKNSAQWRIYGNNINRADGAAPLTSNNQARDPVKSRLDLRGGSRFRNQHNQWRNLKNLKKRNEFHRRQQQTQGAKEQRLRTPYNTFNSQTNQAKQSADIVMTIRNEYQYTNNVPIDLHTSTNLYNRTSSSSISSLIDSVSRIPDNRINNRLASETISHSPNLSNEVFAAGAPANCLLEPSLDTTTADSESIKVSKMAHNVLLLLKSVAQKTAQGEPSELFQNLDWLNGLKDEPQNDSIQN